MPSGILKLENIIDFTRWQPLQNSIAENINLSLVIMDYKNSYLTSVSGQCEFCKNIQSSNRMMELCHRCYSMASLEAFRINKPYIFKCIFNITKVIIPIIIDEKYLGCVITGQVILDKSFEDQGVFSYNNMLERYIYDTKLCEYMEYYNKLPRENLDSLNIKINMICKTIDYIVNLGSIENYLDEDRTLEIDSSNSEYTYFDIKDAERPNINPILLPVLQHISYNINAKITLYDMAKLSHVSSGHFSRLFSAEMGMSFSDYLTKERLKVAKNLLLTTDNTITIIAQKLGYYDLGYFIKVFKKLTSLTPAKYRERYAK